MNLQDGLARDWYDKDWQDDDRREFTALAGYDLPADGMAFNLGAHHGLVSMLIRKRLLPYGKVIAVELDKFNYDLCRDNVSSNQISGIECINAAVAHGYNSYVQFRGAANNSIDLNHSALKSLCGMKTQSVTIDGPQIWISRSDIYGHRRRRGLGNAGGKFRALQYVKVWFVELHGDRICSNYGGRNVAVGSALFENGYNISLARKSTDTFKRINSAQDIPPDRCYIIAAK